MQPENRWRLARWLLAGFVLGAGLVLYLVWDGARVPGYVVARSGAITTFEPSAEPPPRVGEPGVRPRNLVVVVADGFGFSHLALARQTEGIAALWPEFSIRGWHDPRPLWGPITDSAAGATAMASGQLTHNDRVGIDADGQPIPNLFERAWAAGYRTGVVTDSYVWDATPAAFVVHSASRDDSRDILEKLAASQLDVLFGEMEDVGEDGNPTAAETRDIISRRFTLLDAGLDAPPEADLPVATLFDEDAVTNMQSTPNLLQLTNVALARLADTGAPFLLLVESEEMDNASHTGDTDRAVDGLLTIASVLTRVLEFARTRGDTLVVFTADHETGGLALSYEIDSYPNLRPTWATADHTAALVPILADGPGATSFASVSRIWQIGELLNRFIVNSRGRTLGSE